MRHGRTEATGGGFQSIHVVAAERAGALRLPAHDLQNFFQRENPRLGYQHSACQKGTRRLGAAPVMGYWLSLHGEFEAERGAAMPRPISQGAIGDGLDNLRGLMKVEKPLPVDDIRLRRSSRYGFRRCRHTATKRYSERTFKSDLGGALLYSYDEQTDEPGQNFNLNAPASPKGNTDEPPEGWHAYGVWADEGGNNLD